MAATLVMRLQTVISREVDPSKQAVVTVGRIQAGTKNDIISSSAVLDLTVRTFDQVVADRNLAAVTRMVTAEAAASNAPEPEIVIYDHLPVTDNDESATARIQEAFSAEFGEGHRAMTPMAGSEDFSIVPRAFEAPHVFWGFGAFNSEAWNAAQASGEPHAFPGNH